MKIKLLNNSEYPISVMNFTGGNLEISFTDKTVEELETIFADKTSIAKIEQLDDSGSLASSIVGYTNLLQTVSKDGVKTVILAKEVDQTQQRLAEAEAKLATAQTELTTALAELENTKAYIDKTVVELTLLVSTMSV